MEKYGDGIRCSPCKRKLDANSMKIVCLYPASLSGWRGTTASLKNMVNVFHWLGIRTDLISYHHYSDKYYIERKDINSLLSSTTIYLPTYLGAIKIFSVIIGIFYAWYPAKNCSLIFSHVDVLSGFPSLLLSIRYNKPIILHYIDDEPNFLLNKLNACILKRADAVLAISDYLADKAVNYGCKRVIYLPAFVDINLFKADIYEREKIRNDLGIRDSDVVIGYTGTFAYYEGVSNLIYAFNSLSKKCSNIKMVILGAIGKNYENIPGLVKDLNLSHKIWIIPPQPHEDVPKFLSGCDILCCPKIDCEINRAAHPIKIVEYLSMGLPIICSSVGGIISTIEDGVDGILVKPGDIEDLEEKLHWMLRNPEAARLIGENGRKKAVKMYSCETIRGIIKQAIEIM